MSHNTAGDHSAALHQSQPEAIAGNFLLAGSDSQSPPFKHPVYCAYKGPSMNPTITENDLLEITPYSQKAPEMGDVILFIPSEFHQPVIHRIIGLDRDGYITRGDNCTKSDPWLTSPENILGQVVRAYRTTRKLTIHGRAAGMARGYYCRLRMRIYSGIFLFIRNVCLSIHNLVWSVNTFRPQCRPRIVCFSATRPYTYRVLLGRKTVGYFDHEQSRWHIKLRYRHRIPSSSLPLPTQGVSATARS